jgi:glycine/D-amino acid oxidase-like deaminating enzyme
MQNCWAVLGYGGNGITYSRLAAGIIRSALAGGRTPTPTSTPSARKGCDILPLSVSEYLMARWCIHTMG